MRYEHMNDIRMKGRDPLFPNGRRALAWIEALFGACL